MTIAPSRPIEREKDFQAAVIAMAQAYGWKPYHTYLSWRSVSGFPDLVLAKAGQPVIFAELKTNTGELTAAQGQWIYTLQQTVGCEVHVWRPRDWEMIVMRLKLRERLDHGAGRHRASACPRGSAGTGDTGAGRAARRGRAAQAPDD